MQQSAGEQPHNNTLAGFGGFGPQSIFLRIKSLPLPGIAPESTTTIAAPVPDDVVEIEYVVDAVRFSGWDA